MPAFRNVDRVDIGDWMHEGEFREDTQYYDTTYAVIAHCTDGSAYVHENSFLNDPDGANRLADRVEARGIINLAHWGFHEFWSRTLEERLGEEAFHEELHRGGHGHLSNGFFSEGHV